MYIVCWWNYINEQFNETVKSMRSFDTRFPKAIFCHHSCYQNEDVNSCDNLRPIPKVMTLRLTQSTESIKYCIQTQHRKWRMYTYIRAPPVHNSYSKWHVSNMKLIPTWFFIYCSETIKFAMFPMKALGRCKLFYPSISINNYGLSKSHGNIIKIRTWKSFLRI